jgi:hypothetical protein
MQVLKSTYLRIAFYQLLRPNDSHSITIDSWKWYMPKRWTNFAQLLIKRKNCTSSSVVDFYLVCSLKNAGRYVGEYRIKQCWAVKQDEKKGAAILNTGIVCSRTIPASDVRGLLYDREFQRPASFQPNFGSVGWRTSPDFNNISRTWTYSILSKTGYQEFLMQTMRIQNVTI